MTLALISCTKPAQESTSTSDSTGTESTQSTTSSGEERQPVTLTAAETERVMDEIFLAMHNGLIYRDRQVSLKEEFKVDGNSFDYVLIRDNGDNAGMTSQSWGGMRPPTQEEQDAWDADTTKDKEPLYGEAYTETEYRYTSEIDTLYVTGYFKAYADEPESTPRKLTIEFGGDGLTHKNANEVDGDGVPHFRPQVWGYYNPEEGMSLLDDEYLYVDLSEPLTFRKEDLYMKAIIKDLTDADLAGLTKDDLTFIRNDIFAHHGHTFKTTKMITHYQPTDWYRAAVADAAPLLNKFEKRNVEFIKKKEG
ncbi:MAG: YARHG domain-containing protein [Bacteroidota bacterium]